MGSAVVRHFSLYSIANTHALRPSVVEVHGHRIGLPGVASPEPLLRGCDQRGWLERLVALGIRHLVVPLNGSDEDTCLYARRHPATPGGVVYDLERRDEGVCARLQFLLDAAAKAGVMVGFSLFDPRLPEDAGPFARQSNSQHVCWRDLCRARLEAPRHSRRRTSSLRRRAGSDLRLEDRLAAAVDWMAAELRARTAVWVQVFRQGHGNASSEPLRRLEDRLARRLAAALALPGEDPAKARLGPWLAVPPGFDWEAVPSSHRAPFDVWPAHALDHAAGVPGAMDGRRPPLLYDFGAGCHDRVASAARPRRAELWRAVMHGCWPVVPCGFANALRQRGWKYLAQLAVFGRLWIGDAYLRPCPEMLARVPAGLVVGGTVSAATDGCGRYFAYWSRRMDCAVELSVLPGTYRYYWFDPAAGKGLDRGEGLEGGRCCRVPGPGRAREALLVLEQEELPDPFSVW